MPDDQKQSNRTTNISRAVLTMVSGVLCALAGILVLVLPISATQADERHAAFLGAWVLNAELSDDPQEISGSDRDRGGRGGGFGGRRGGFGGRDGDGNRPAPEDIAERRTGIQEGMRDLTSVPRRMTISGSQDEVILTYDDGRVIRLLPDGREHAGLAGSRMRLTRTTRWDSATLITDIELEGRLRFEVKQTYEVRNGEAGKQLIVTSRFGGGPFREEEREFRRIYDAENQPEGER
jgi:hypothetical protein